LLGF
jgi:hypothetical protein